MGQGAGLRLGPGTVSNCTFFGNIATTGGAIFRGGTNTNPLKIINCTIVGNTANGSPSGGGIYYNSSSTSAGVIHLINTVLSSNTGSNGADVYINNVNTTATNTNYLATNQNNFVASASFGGTAVKFAFSSNAALATNNIAANAKLSAEYR